MMEPASSTAIERTPLLVGDTPKSLSQGFMLRPAHISDLPLMALHAKEAYWNSPINKFLAPRAEEHPEDMVRSMQQMIQHRFVNWNNLSIVAYISGNGGEKEVVVGYGQFARYGIDENAKIIVREKGWRVRVALWVLSWYFWITSSITNRLWPDRISDPKIVKDFEECFRKDTEIYWGPNNGHPERWNRWHAQSVVVSPEYQGKGIGRLLMSHLIERATWEGVPIGLTASPQGERLYQKLGFTMLGDFYRRVANDEGGGIMIWWPEVTQVTESQEVR